MIHVIATIEVQPGTREEFLTHMTWVTPLVQEEEGCIEYNAAIDTPTTIPVQVPSRPEVVIVIEKWVDVAALQAHLHAPHMAEYRTRVKDYVVKVSLQVLEPA
jgi:quinol monooxygenase YgiN